MMDDLTKPVVHIRRSPHYDVYIGRTMNRFRLTDVGWGNPFVVEVDGDLPTVLRKFEAYLWSRADLLRRLPDLDGKILACWCAPVGGLGIDDPLICHGQVLLRVLRAERARHTTQK